MNLNDVRVFQLGNGGQIAWNKKLCFEARDTFYDCVDEQPNGNKYRCPDQMYAYEQWCPADFRRIHTAQRSQKQIDECIYDSDWVAGVNKSKQSIT